MNLALVAGLCVFTHQDPNDLLVYMGDDGKSKPVRSVREWETKREQILAGMQQAMGKLPRSKTSLLDVKIGDEVKEATYIRRSVTFASLDRDRIPAYLYLPRPARRGGPAILALHPTSPLGKGVVDGQGERENRAYARELAARGYVVLAPDYPSFGDYSYAFDDAKYTSGTMKGIVDHMRGVDLLQSLPEVDPERIGVIGHSLGGHNAMFVAAFDERLKVVVSSCGWTMFHDYYGGKIKGWTSKRYMPLLRERYALDPGRVPFDFDGVIAALAPRPFFSSSPERDGNFAVAGVRRAEKLVRPVYEFLGAPHNFDVAYPGCAHDFPTVVRERAYRFLDMALGRGRPEKVGTARFLATPKAGVRTNGRSFYTRARGVEKMSLHSHQTRSDTADVAFQRFSKDNGRSWSEAKTLKTNAPRDGGTFRRYFSSAFVAPERDELMMMIVQGVLPGDDPLAGMKHWTLRYALSRDGGRSFWHEAPVVHVGAGYSPEHPLPGVRAGKNSMMIGATTCAAIQVSSGEILQPVQITPMGSNGEYHNPGGGYTYHDAAVLIGTFNDGGTLDWRVSARVSADPKLSTRGMIEPTIIEAKDGRILMVMRGSNDRRGKIPGYRWRSISKDRGRTFSAPEPWTYRSGKRFFSASTCCQLLRHSNGRVYWLGNIAPTNPRANHPRHPLVIGEVEEGSLLLIESSITVIDRRRDGDGARLQLSNFFAYEDRESHEIVVHCTPIGRRHPLSAKRADSPTFDWTGDSLLYRIRVPR